MAYAAMRSLEEVRDAHRRTEVRQRHHDCVDYWLQQVEDHVKEAPAHFGRADPNRLGSPA
jgi:hypothetical protein